MAFLNDDKTMVRTGNVRIIWTKTLFEAESDENKPNDKPKYVLNILVPKTDKATIAELEQAYTNAYEKGVKTCFGGKRPPIDTFFERIKDGDTAVNSDGDLYNIKTPALIGNYLVKGRTQFEIDKKVFDEQTGVLRKAESLDDIQSGCYGRAILQFKPFKLDDNSNKGVTIYPVGVVKIKDGEAVGGSGGVTAASYGDINPDDVF